MGTPRGLWSPCPPVFLLFLTWTLEQDWPLSCCTALGVGLSVVPCDSVAVMRFCLLDTRIVSEYLRSHLPFTTCHIGTNDVTASFYWCCEPSCLGEGGVCCFLTVKLRFPHF